MSFRLIDWAAFAGLVFAIYLINRRSNRKLPPSPKGLPLLGNVLQMPKRNGWLLMHEWSKALGPIFHLNMAGQPVIVLNSNEAALELLERRSHIYSDRPRLIMTGEIMSQNLVVGFQRFGEQWKRFRKAAHAGINIRAAEAYYGIMERESALLVQEFHRDPKSWDDHLQRVIASSLFTALYGGEPMLNKNDPIVDQINDCMHRLTGAALPGAFLVDVFPILKRLPDWLYKPKGEGYQWYKKDNAMFNDWIDRVKKDMDGGSPPPSFGRVLLEAQKQFQLEDFEVPWLAGSMFGAGSDATAGSMRWFMLAATLFPDKIKRAQDEIDLVVGRSRLPTFDDRESMPYLRAFCREVMRWRTVAPLGVPHRLIQDDHYMGYHIPAGSIVLANIYSINRSPEAFSDAEEFIPDRFLNEEGTFEVLHPETHNQGHYTFGFGRRACAGMHIANNLLFINAATILWAFNIRKAKDAQGNEITPSATNYHDTGLIVRPHLWEVEIIPRSPEVLDMARERFAKGVNG
ncbi:hypothetical protein D9758_011135 [Tetrapyrgos nigripes]|uniref:Cytochrome P450 n=1 Tax=Tetrapyrgos nigripes TaxID=182062 RepID=A0A8H5CLD2_9AGAR|nr:hypothetical protein D9758_011135 [Tetrapyrgos nigripes]